MVALHTFDGDPCLETLLPSWLDSPESREAINVEVDERITNDVINELFGLPTFYNRDTVPKFDSWAEVDPSVVDEAIDAILDELGVGFVVVV